MARYEINGVDEIILQETQITGSVFSLGRNVPELIGNPLYHWNQLELARYFNIYELLRPSSADHIYSQCNDRLERRTFLSKAY